MRVLLAAKHAPHGSRMVGGVQSWCRTVASELVSRGCEAVTWGPEQAVPLGGFDFGIISNAKDASRAFELCRKSIVVSHGIIEAERPPENQTVVFTSEEIRDHWQGDGPVIRQPIDLDFWSPFWNLEIYITRFSYRTGLAFVPAVAESMEFPYLHIKNKKQPEALKYLRQSACVLATGRAALEAMACDVPVVICDHRSSYQPALMDLNIKQAMMRNYSGRGGVTPTPENLRAAIEQAREKGGMRSHVEKWHDVKKIVDELMALS